MFYGVYSCILLRVCYFSFPSFHCNALTYFRHNTNPIHFLNLFFCPFLINTPTEEELEVELEQHKTDFAKASKTLSAAEKSYSSVHAQLDSVTPKLNEVKFVCVHLFYVRC